MSRAPYEVLGLGNSLVDILAYAKDDFLSAQGMRKGAMTLIDEARAETLYAAREQPVIESGGSAANTIVGVGSFGLRSAYIGKVKDDSLGRAFVDDIHSMGVAFATTQAADGPATGRCFVYVTPDGERTMNTYLGASQLLSPNDVDDELVRSTPITYLEGYMWDRPAAKQAFQKAARIAHEGGNRVALTLSDSFCVDRFRDEFLGLLRGGLVDTVFANTEEVLSLYRTANFEDALEALRAEGVLGVVTRSEKGCVVVEGAGTTEVPAFPIDRLIDTTGAGDMFAAGFLAGLARGASRYACGRLGGMAAAEVIQHIGPRPQISLKERARLNNLAV